MILALANHNLNECYSSYFSFLQILLKVDAFNKQVSRKHDEDTADPASTIPIAHFCSNHPKHSIRLSGDYYGIILFFVLSNISYL